MVRSKLSTKFSLHQWQLYEKAFKEKYKAEEGQPFKGNVAQYVTLGVIQRKKLPDVEDVINLIKLGNVSCGDDGAEAILDGWLNDDNNRDRGLAGAFCDICKDFCFDIPIHPQIKEQIYNLEDTINKIQDAMNQFSKLVEHIGSLTSRLEEAKNKTGETVKESEVLEVDKENTQENK